MAFCRAWLSPCNKFDGEEKHCRGTNSRPRNSLRGTVTRQNCLTENAVLNRSGKYKRRASRFATHKKMSTAKQKVANGLDLRRKLLLEAQSAGLLFCLHASCLQKCKAGTHAYLSAITNLSTAMVLFSSVSRTKYSPLARLSREKTTVCPKIFSDVLLSIHAQWFRNCLLQSNHIVWTFLQSDQYCLWLMHRGLCL